ncbi:ATP-dependent DNA helicase [Streptomyces viridosporus ATCC 14672]|uniref:ATP-dependent DNA helicase n=1 Tax=Streptomyces viridosporus (strain ATCC 14672 / DSM 40746 / JCM 4963 / KCTC 9882 / NRRL B-12104 / FH 1290) TaxID=566461 RepID=D5ZYZ4_STRV1|nr:ATP-dependent DNA helicase [Streptomyces viridosporus ATCC 14672]
MTHRTPRAELRFLRPGACFGIRCRYPRLASACARSYHRPRSAQGTPRHPVHPGADGLHHRAARPAGDRGRSRIGQDHGDGGPRGVAGRHRPGRPRTGARPHLHQQGRR